MFESGVSPDYIDRIVDELSREQSKLMSLIKTSMNDVGHKDYTRQITILNQLQMLFLRLRNIKTSSKNI